MTSILEPLLTVTAIPCQPLVEGSRADVHLPGHRLLGEALLQVQLHRSQPIGESPPEKCFRRSPPRGGGVLLLLLYMFMLVHVDASLSLKCQPISCLVSSHELVVSTIPMVLSPMHDYRRC